LATLCLTGASDPILSLNIDSQGIAVIAEYPDPARLNVGAALVAAHAGMFDYLQI
jgi:hypothetical protein